MGRVAELRDTVVTSGPGSHVGPLVLAEDIAIALNNSNVFVFGLRPDGDKRFIGDKEVDFNNEEIIIMGKSYKVTKGLFREDSFSPTCRNGDTVVSSVSQILPKVFCGQVE